MIAELQCLKCKHLNPGKGNFTCKAFPDGIPDEIRYGEHDHAEPFNGDHGVQFTPSEKK